MQSLHITKQRPLEPFFRAIPVPLGRAKACATCGLHHSGQPAELPCCLQLRQPAGTTALVAGTYSSNPEFMPAEGTVKFLGR